MSTTTFIVFDLKNGLVKNWWKYLLAFIVALLLSLDFARELPLAQASLKLPQLAPTLGDYLVNLVAGIHTYVYDSGDPFPFPAAWFLLFFLLAYLTLHYPYRDLMGAGSQLLMQAGSRWSWWLSKCVWAAASVLVFFAACASAVLLWTAVSKGSFSFEVSAATPKALGFADGSLPPHAWQVGWLFYAALVIVSVAVCLVQMLLSLVFKPVISYLCTLVFLFFSAYFQADVLMGNFLMAARSSYLVDGGMQASTGAALGLGVVVLCVAAGGLYFKNMDILEGERGT